MVRATSWLNELIEAYSPRKRSSTLANRNRPVPTYFCSSNSIVTSTPRQKPLPVGSPIRPTTRRLVTASDAVDQLADDRGHLLAHLGVGEVVEPQDLLKRLAALVRIR